MSFTPLIDDQVSLDRARAGRRNATRRTPATATLPTDAAGSTTCRDADAPGDGPHHLVHAMGSRRVGWVESRKEGA